MDARAVTAGLGSYEYPSDLRKRKRMGYVLVPVLFYVPILIGLALSGGGGGVGTNFLLVLVMFLSIFVGLLLLIVHGQRLWVEIDGPVMRVEGREFQLRHLVAMGLEIKGRTGLEPINYVITFDVLEPPSGPVRFETHPIHSVRDADTLVRDLRRLLPGLDFHDRTPMAKAYATKTERNSD